MNPQTTQNDSPQNIELRIRTMRILWIAMCLSIGAYFAFTIFSGRAADVKPNNTVSVALVVAAVLIILISFPIKGRLLSRAVEQRQVQLVQQGYIVTWAITEV